MRAKQGSLRFRGQAKIMCAVTMVKMHGLARPIHRLERTELTGAPDGFPGCPADLASARNRVISSGWNKSLRHNLTALNRPLRTQDLTVCGDTRSPSATSSNVSSRGMESSSIAYLVLLFRVGAFFRSKNSSKELAGINRRLPIRTDVSSPRSTAY